MADQISLRPFATNLCTDEVFAWAKQWIAKCKSDHDGCFHDYELHLPSRVIDVGTDADSEVKLHLTQADEQEAYVALSYCWGGAQEYVATTTTLEEMTLAIDVPRLSKSAQDAIEVTRRLGFRYLWVDALCILQDSLADKSREIQMMGQIYKRAAVTVAASAAEGASQGFLRPSRAGLPSAKFQFNVPGKGESTVFVTSSNRLAGIDPLNKRGWTLQEWLLSPRLLVFSKHDMIWHCQTEERKTVTKSCILYNEQSARESLFYRRYPRGPEGSPVRANDQISMWHYVIEDYSARMLSEPEDRLNAVAGVASELAALWGDEYAFGLWENSFIENLHWRKRLSDDGNYPDSRRSARAPSWSWASLDCAVDFTTAILRPSGAGLEEVKRYYQASVVSCPLDGSRKVALQCKMMTAAAFGSIFAGSEHSTQILWDIASEESMLEEVQFLLLRDVERKYKNGCSGILVVPAMNQQEGVLRRAGFFDVSSDDRDKGFWGHENEQVVELV